MTVVNRSTRFAAGLPVGQPAVGAEQVGELQIVGRRWIDKPTIAGGVTV